MLAVTIVDGDGRPGLADAVCGDATGHRLALRDDVLALWNHRLELRRAVERRALRGAGGQHGTTGGVVVCLDVHPTTCHQRVERRVDTGHDRFEFAVDERVQLTVQGQHAQRQHDQPRLPVDLHLWPLLLWDAVGDPPVVTAQLVVAQFRLQLVVVLGRPRRYVVEPAVQPGNGKRATAAGILPPVGNCPRVHVGHLQVVLLVPASVSPWRSCSPSRPGTSHRRLVCSSNVRPDERPVLAAGRLPDRECRLFRVGGLDALDVATSPDRRRKVRLHVADGLQPAVGVGERLAVGLLTGSRSVSGGVVIPLC